MKVESTLVFRDADAKHQWSSQKLSNLTTANSLDTSPPAVKRPPNVSDVEETIKLKTALKRRRQQNAQTAKEIILLNTKDARATKRQSK